MSPDESAASVDPGDDSAVLERLAALGLSIPTPAVPIANYVPVARAGEVVFTSGQLPTVNGAPHALGIVGGDVSLDTARECAQLCVLNALAALRAELGSLAAVEGVVKLFAAVASAPNFYEQSAVADGASDLLVAAFGGIGRHARTVVGVTALPRGVPVELDLVVRVRHPTVTGLGA